MSSLDTIMEASYEAFLQYTETTPAARADFLDTIATEIENLGEKLIHTAMEEAHLPEARFLGERGRTCGQLRAFATLLREGSWVNAVIETALPDRAPLAKPDMRKVDIALGPVVVFGASNFPLAYSTAGGDTASALAAGCPVVVKGHPSHPKTSALVAGAIQAAVTKCGMPANTFQHVDGTSFEIGKALVQHPRTAAVGFTGSLVGGRAIFDYGQQRANPIPVFAEMGSTNPVIFLPEILHTQGVDLAKKMAVSITMGVGQFCTNPGIILGIDGPDLDAFSAQLGESLAASPSFTMLNEGIHRNYLAKLEQITSAQGVKTIYISQDNQEMKAPPMVACVDSATMKQNNHLHEECFGPSTLVVRCRHWQDLVEVWKMLHGQLSTSLWGTENDLKNHSDLVVIGREIAGRLVFNAVPTGVDVNAATVHGGPYPSSTDGRFTSVGMDAIKRWVRPICYQDCPDFLLPHTLKNSNPSGILRKVNGQYTREAI
jgi:2,5-dioxopentanoate dehydrogenase